MEVLVEIRLSPFLIPNDWKWYNKSNCAFTEASSSHWVLPRFLPVTRERLSRYVQYWILRWTDRISRWWFPGFKQTKFASRVEEWVQDDDIKRHAQCPSTCSGIPYPIFVTPSSVSFCTARIVQPAKWPKRVMSSLQSLRWNRLLSELTEIITSSTSRTRSNRRVAP